MQRKLVALILILAAIAAALTLTSATTYAASSPAAPTARPHVRNLGPACAGGRHADPSPTLRRWRPPVQPVRDIL
jgi:hypothetical protein